MMEQYNRINIGRGSVAGKRNCMIKRCRCRDKFLIFVDDGEPMLSRLFGTSCKGHLSLAVSKAIEYNREELEKFKRKKRRQDIKKAKEILKLK